MIGERQRRRLRSKKRRFEKLRRRESISEKLAELEKIWSLLPEGRITFERGVISFGGYQTLFVVGRNEEAARNIADLLNLCQEIFFDLEETLERENHMIDFLENPPPEIVLAIASATYRERQRQLRKELGPAYDPQMDVQAHSLADWVHECELFARKLLRAARRYHQELGLGFLTQDS